MPKKESIPDHDPPIQIQLIERRIHLIRGQKAMLDCDLAELYQVKPIVLRQQVKRNLERFPEDFMFQLTEKEAEMLVSQSVIPSKKSLGGYLPYVFTQKGVAMLSSVLRQVSNTSQCCHNASLRQTQANVGAKRTSLIANSLPSLENLASTISISRLSSMRLKSY